MKSVFTTVVVSGLAMCLGCNQSEPGGPGAKATTSHNGTAVASKHDTFRISAPALDTSIKQGEQKEVTVEVDRGNDFKQDVTLSFKGDKGITVSPESSTVKASSKDTKVKVMIAAEKNAPVGEATVHVTGKPEAGDSTSADFKVKVQGS